MTTAWVLVFMFYPFSNYSSTLTIENLKSAEECTRVANVLIDWRRPASSDYKCVEVIKK